MLDDEENKYQEALRKLLLSPSKSKFVLGLAEFDEIEEDEDHDQIGYAEEAYGEIDVYGSHLA